MDRSIATGLIAVLVFATSALAEDHHSNSPAEDFARDIVALSNLILQHHVEPPARQQVVLTAARAVYLARGHNPPHDLAHRCSSSGTDDKFFAILVEAYGKEFSAEAKDQRELADRFAGRTTSSHELIVAPETQRKLYQQVSEALAKELDGGLTFLSPKASTAQQQLAENRYVGVGIAAGQTEDRKFVIRAVMPGGPMDRAGIPAETIIVSIDGWPTVGQGIEECVERLRGPEGSSVALVIHRSTTDHDEPLTLNRGVVPRKSLNADVRQLPDRRIAILRPEAITASLPHEVRAFAQAQPQL
ncbi:MAG TPA: PDZ domain-containing protein, partial [Caulifigura sp.]|nr:PDZ domain-containing protein [Caulifigura sp.]